MVYRNNSTSIDDTVKKCSKEHLSQLTRPNETQSISASSTPAADLPLPPQFLDFLQQNNIDPAIYSRHSSVPRFFRLRSRCNPNTVLPELTAELGFSPQPVRWLPGFFSLPASASVASCAAYRRGDLFGIDAASGAAVAALGVTPSDHVLDLCCAPGAKLCMLADLQQQQHRQEQEQQQQEEEKQQQQEQQQEQIHRHLGTLTGVDVSAPRLSACRSLLQKYRLAGRVRLFLGDARLFAAPPPVAPKETSAKAVLMRMSEHRRGRGGGGITGGARREKDSRGPSEFSGVPGAVTTAGQRAAEAAVTKEGGSSVVEAPTVPERGKGGEEEELEEQGNSWGRTGEGDGRNAAGLRGEVGGSHCWSRESKETSAPRLMEEAGGGGITGGRDSGPVEEAGGSDSGAAGEESVVPQGSVGARRSEGDEENEGLQLQQAGQRRRKSRKERRRAKHLKWFEQGLAREAWSTRGSSLAQEEGCTGGGGLPRGAVESQSGGLAQGYHQAGTGEEALGYQAGADEAHRQEEAPQVAAGGQAQRALHQGAGGGDQQAQGGIDAHHDEAGGAGQRHPELFFVGRTAWQWWDPHGSYSREVEERAVTPMNAAAISSVGYDKVLVDAECTHDGSVKHVLKYEDWGWDTLPQRFLQQERLVSLFQLQLGLLRRGFELLREGGRLVYCTCSFTEAQNEAVVGAFLREREGEAVVLECEEAKQWPCCEGKMKHTFRFSPDVSNTSGLFLVLLTKVK